MGCDGTDIGKTIHPHPTPGESIGRMAKARRSVRRRVHGLAATAQALMS